MFTQKSQNIDIPSTPPKQTYYNGCPDAPQKTHRARSVGMIRHDNEFQPKFASDPEPNN